MITKPKPSLIVSFVAVVVLLATALLPATAGAQTADATVTVVHGIPGQDLGLAPELPVDVSVNGDCVLTGFEFGEFSPRLSLPEGSYDIQVRVSDGACGGAVAIDAPGVAVPAGVDASVVAHLDTDGAPTASVFVNDLSPLGLYRTGLAVHHVANAPAVDIDVTRAVGWSTPFIEFDNVVNGDQGVGETWVGNYTVDISPAGGDPIFSAPATFISGEHLAVYAVGSLTNSTFTLLVDVR